MTTAGVGLHREQFATADLTQAREFLARAYGTRLWTARPPEDRPVLAVTRMDAGSFTVSDMSLSADLIFAVDASDQVTISTVVEGTLRADRAQRTDRYQAGDVHIGATPQAGYTGRTRGLRDCTVTLPVSLLYAVAGQEPASSAPLRFLSPHPAGPAARAQWTTAARYVTELLANPDAAIGPLVITGVARLLAATALSVFPNTAQTSPAPRDRRDASAVTMRRATAFIDEHAGQDITMADIAAAACVTVRAVQIAFRRELDITPIAYLRTVRLARAHRELLEADPGQETVTAVAYRWGFASPGRFAAYYRQAYGVPPRQTLEHD